MYIYMNINRNEIKKSVTRECKKGNEYKKRK